MLDFDASMLAPDGVATERTRGPVEAADVAPKGDPRQAAANPSPMGARVTARNGLGFQNSHSVQSPDVAWLNSSWSRWAMYAREMRMRQSRAMKVGTRAGIFAIELTLVVMLFT